MKTWLSRLRVKYIYQQFISHFTVIFIPIIVLSLIFAHYIENFIYENKVNELISYGEKIVFDINRSRDTTYVLNSYQTVLASQKIEYNIFNKDRQIIYPTGGRITINDEDWERIRNGETVAVKRDFKRFQSEGGVTFVLMPVFQNHTFIGGVLLTSPISDSSQMISQINKYLFFTVIVSLLISILLSILLSKIHVKRIKRLQDATSLVAEGDYSAKVPSSKFDEIGDLAEDFNKMVDQLQKSNEEIKTLERRRRQFMADVSHELRTPLTTISGVVEGIRNHMIPDEEKDKGMNLVSKETKRLIRLVNENLDYEKIRSNQVKLQKENIQMYEVLDIIKEQLDLLAEEKKNEIIVDVKEDVFVLADYDRLTQILINIVKNSIQFTESGTIYLRSKAGFKETIIEIEDTGIGMDANEIENIWRRFYKADISRANNPYGEFGLGLSIVKKLVQLHDGQIKVTSEKGKGTKFEIKIPYNK